MMTKLLFALALAAGPLAAQAQEPAQAEAQEPSVVAHEPVAEHEQHPATNWVSFGLQSATFVIFVVGLVMFAKKPMRAMFLQRHQDVKKAVEEAQAAKLAAEAKFAEYQKKMGALDSELEKLRGTMKANAEAERTRLVSEAEAAKKRIERDTEAMITQELGRAREQLKAEAAELAVKMAEDILRREMKPEDQKHLVADYTKTLGAAPSKAEAA